MSLTEHIKPYGPIPEAQDLTVADLLTDDLRWNTKRIEKCYLSSRSKWLAREWNFAQRLMKHEQKSLPGGINYRKPQQSGHTSVICRSDAAWEQSAIKAGLAWIISGTSNTIIRQGSTTQEFVNSPIVAEALALRLEIIAAVNLGIPKIKMLSDNSTLIRVINNDT